MRLRLLICLIACTALPGCGTTRWTDTSRTATEQLLMSDAIDRSVSRINFEVLEGQDVYLDTSYLTNVVDKDYLVSTLRQHMLASGCTLKEKKEESQFIVEARAGAVGTDRHDLLCGMPATNIGMVPISPGTPTAIPEIALAKRTDQKGVAKLAVFAYHRESGEPVWQSGTDTIASKAQNSWWLGVGPLQRGTIYDKAQFAGREFRFPFANRSKADEPRTVRVTRETEFRDPRLLAKARQDGDELAQFGDSLEIALGPMGVTQEATASAVGPASVGGMDGEVPPGDAEGPFPLPSTSFPSARLLGPTLR